MRCACWPCFLAMSVATSSIAYPNIVERPEAVHPVNAIPADGAVFAYFVNDASARAATVTAIVNVEPRVVTTELLGGALMIRVGALQEGDRLQLTFGVTEPFSAAWDVTAPDDAVPLIVRAPTVVAVEQVDDTVAPFVAHTVEATIVVDALDDVGLAGYGARAEDGALLTFARPLNEIVVPLSPQRQGDLCFDVVAFDAALRERSAPVCVAIPADFVPASEADQEASCATGAGASWLALLMLGLLCRVRAEGGSRLPRRALPPRARATR